MMCDFFSFCTEPDKHGGGRFYFDWIQRVEREHEGVDSHSIICKHYGLNEDKCNKYEYNPLTKKFKVDQINSEVDDRLQAEDWVRNLSFKKIVEPLIIKPIINPLKLPKVEEVTDEQIEWLKQGSSVWDSVSSSVGDLVWSSVSSSIGSSVWSSVRNSVWDSVWDSFWGYISSFFAIKYDYDFTPCVKLWESGLVPSFDGTTWRLHSGKKSDVVYEMESE